MGLTRAQRSARKAAATRRAKMNAIPQAPPAPPVVMRPPTAPVAPPVRRRPPTAPVAPKVTPAPQKPKRKRVPYKPAPQIVPTSVGGQKWYSSAKSHRGAVRDAGMKNKKPSVPLINIKDMTQSQIRRHDFIGFDDGAGSAFYKTMLSSAARKKAAKRRKTS